MAGEPKGKNGEMKQNDRNGVFELSREYVESVFKVTGSDVLRKVLDEVRQSPIVLSNIREADSFISGMSMRAASTKTKLGMRLGKK